MKTRLKILAVDDSLVMQRILSDAIEPVGFQALTASNGELALQVVAKHSD